jgi:hypothetical protein
MLRGVAPERPVLFSCVNRLWAHSRLNASVETVLAVMVLSRRSLALGRPACSSRKPQLQLRFLVLAACKKEQAAARPTP